MTRRIDRVIAWAIPLIACAALVASPPSPRHILIRVPVAQVTQIQEIASLGFDIWGVAPDRSHMTIRVSQDEMDQLSELGFDWVVIEPDLYSLPQPTTGGVAGVNWTQYNNLASANQFMQDLADGYPDLASLFTLGDSWGQGLMSRGNGSESLSRRHQGRIVAMERTDGHETQ